MFPATMKHGRSEVLPCQVLVELLVASAVARLREAQRGPKVPRWAARVLRACPNHVRIGISQPGSDWEKQTRALLCEASSGAAVYCLSSHSGWYIGKAKFLQERWGCINAWSPDAVCGTLERLVCTSLQGCLSSQVWHSETLCWERVLLAFVVLRT